MSKVVLISGGTATNSLVPALNDILDIGKISFILPVSDNGGSSAEILNNFGGPAIGDLRSRVTTIHALTQENLFINHRLNSTDSDKALMEWKSLILMIKESEFDQSSTIDSKIFKYFKYLDDIILRDGIDFNFQNASIGNLLMLSLRLYHNLDLYSCSLKFIDLMTSICTIEDKNKTGIVNISARQIFDKFNILPCINSRKIDETFDIAVQLENGDTIIGQNNISHPSTNHIVFNKSDDTPLSSPVNNLFYISENNQETRYELFNKAQSVLENSDVIIYSIGSLITSILPVIILDKFASSILKNKESKKILMLNGNLDRETYGYNIIDFIYQIIRSLIYSMGIYVGKEFIYVNDNNRADVGTSKTFQRSIEKLLEFKNNILNPNRLSFTDFITNIYILQECEIEIHCDIVASLTGISCNFIKSDISHVPGKSGKTYTYNLEDFRHQMEKLLRHAAN